MKQVILLLALLLGGAGAAMANNDSYPVRPGFSAELLTTYDTAREGIADILGIAQGTITFGQTAQTASTTSYNFTTTEGHSGSIVVNHTTKTVTGSEAGFGPFNFIIIRDVVGF